jgi:hypothetical protein
MERLDKHRELAQLLEQLTYQECELTAMIPDQCIALLFFCRSYAGIQYLRDLYASGQLKTYVNKLLTTLLDTVGQTVPFEAETLDWKNENYQQCIEYLNSAQSQNQETYSKSTKQAHCDFV